MSTLNLKLICYQSLFVLKIFDIFREVFRDLQTYKEDFKDLARDGLDSLSLILDYLLSTETHIRALIQHS